MLRLGDAPLILDELVDVIEVTGQNSQSQSAHTDKAFAEEGSIT
jgi:hypothetical protein